MTSKRYLQLFLVLGLLPFAAKAQGIYTSDSADDYNIYVDTEAYSDYPSCGGFSLWTNFNGNVQYGSAQYPNILQFFQSTAASPGVNYPYTINWSYQFPVPLYGCSSASGSFSQQLNILNVVGVSTDDQGNVVVTGDDYNTLVSQGYLPAAAGVAIAVTQPELIPILTATVVVVGAIYITYHAAVYIKNLNYDRLTLDYCRRKLIDCLETPGCANGQTNICYDYCKNNQGQWPTWWCPGV